MSSSIFFKTPNRFQLSKPCPIDHFIMISTGERPRHESIKCSRYYIHTCGSTGYRERPSTIISFRSYVRQCFFFSIFLSFFLSCFFLS